MVGEGLLWILRDTVEDVGGPGENDDARVFEEDDMTFDSREHL